MKNLFFLLSFSILFQSCFSYKSIGYKSIGYNNIEIDKKQKIKVLMLNKTSIKGQLVSKNEKTMILETKDGQGTIPLEEIYDVKVRNFSFLKSAGLTVGVYVAALLTGMSILLLSTL
jgi:hypothetical protein|tara:strand:+ start:858 stop:1208 length:351 start_codon:yes stop_codon:yes gene_type:complete